MSRDGSQFGSPEDGPRRDIIVVGASAGGVEALERLVAALPADLGAAVLIVLHRPPDHPSLLAEILRRAGPLPVSDARDGERPRRGHIAIAPPDRHLVIEGGVLRLVRGPKENHARPSVDVLFRSAAQEFDRRVAGVILSGTLFDGTAGLFAVKRRGGVAIVQDPLEAAFPGMPESAIGNVAVDHVLPVAGIASLLATLARGPEERAEDDADTDEDTVEVSPAMSPEAMSSDRNGSDPDGSVPDEFDQLPDIVRHDQDAQRRGARHGGTSVFTCPECGGTLWQADAGSLIQFRCHVGHAYTGDAMLREQTETLERSLWFAIRLLVDKSLLLRELAEAARRRGDGAVAGVLEAKAREAKAHSDTLRGVLDSEGAPAAALTPGG